MTALIVIACILLALVLICQLRFGAIAEYSDAGFGLALKLGPIRVSVHPKEENEGKKRRKKKGHKEGAETEKPKRKTKDTVSLAKKFIPVLGESAGKLRRKIRIDELVLHVIWADPDPAAAAMGYGAGHAVLGFLWHIFEHNFQVKSYDLQVNVDFERKNPVFLAKIQSTVTVGQGLALALSLGFKAIKIFLGARREQTDKKAVQA